MEKDFEQAKVEFDNMATKIFFSLYGQFKNTIKFIDRRKDENVFQQLQGKFVFSLTNQLQNLAKEIIHKHQHLKNAQHLNRILTDAISSYINEFTQKSNSI